MCMEEQAKTQISTIQLCNFTPLSTIEYQLSSVAVANRNGLGFLLKFFDLVRVD